jgi:hypothetical protein
MGGTLEPVLRRMGAGHDGLSKVEQVFFSLAHQAEEDFALATTLPTKAVHDFLQGVLELVGLRLQRGRWRVPLRRDLRDELEDFF